MPHCWKSHVAGRWKKEQGVFILNKPIATKVVCFSRLLKCLRSLYGKQCGPRSDCSSPPPPPPPPPANFVCGGYTVFTLSVCPSIRAFIPPANFVCGGYTVFTLSVRACVRPSLTFCFLNILKSHCWIFIKPCKHVHICKANTLDKKVRARGQFYWSYFPL